MIKIKPLDVVLDENKNLIYSISHYFENYTNKEDLYQAGVVGLITAYKNYNPEFNNKFSTYAYQYILGEMKKYVREDKGIKISRDISKLNLKIEKCSILLAQKLMRKPSIKEIANFLNIEEYQIAEALKSTNSLQSLDETICNDSKEITLYDTIGSRPKVDIIDSIMLKDELEKLPEPDKTIIKNRYLNDMTQKEIGKKLGMSQVQVSRYEQKILTKLKSKLYC
jgi:RNA polymerase sporulation-specific sigma factor